MLSDIIASLFQGFFIGVIIILVVFAALAVLGITILLSNPGRLKAAKKVAREILDHGKIDNFARFNKVCDILAEKRYDRESAELLEKLKDLKNKQAKS